MIEAIQITLQEGGLTLLALLILAVAIYSILYGAWVHLSKARKLMAEKLWLNPQQVVNTLPWETPAPQSKEIQRLFTCFELDEIAWIERRLPFLGVLITSAPLLGLLGTVAGMLVTFAGMASAEHGSVDTISSGISKALVTTQAGLVIAIPAAFFLALIKRQMETTRLHLHAQLCECLVKIS